jgi:hypothetical protein
MLSTALGATLLVSLLVDAPSAEPRPAAPPVAPAPRALLDESAFGMALDRVIVPDGIRALEAARCPAGGLEVFAVEEGSQSARLGIALRDVLVDLDGAPLDTLEDLRRARQGALAPQVLTLWNDDDGRRTLTLDLGHLGLWLTPAVRRPASGYLASAERSPAWDRLLVGAALTAHDDPELALTALAHAQALGYRGPFLSALQATATCALGRYAEASLALEAGLPAARSAAGADALRTLYSAALVDGRLEEARAVLARFPELGEDGSGFAPYLADLAARRARHAPPVDPLDAVAATPPIDLRGVMRCTCDRQDITDVIVDPANWADCFDVDCQVGRNKFFEIEVPPVATLDCTVVCDLTFWNRGINAQRFDLSIADPGNLQRPYFFCDPANADLDFSAQVTNHHDAGLVLRDLPHATVPIPHLVGNEHVFSVHVAIRDGLVGWSINGRRFAPVPLIGRPGPKSLYVFIVGGHLKVTHFELSTHDPAPPAGWKPLPPPPPARPAVPEALGAADF